MIKKEKIPCSNPNTITACVGGRFLWPPPDSVIHQQVSGLSQLLYSQLWFIMVKEYKAKSVKGEGLWGKVWGKPGSSFQSHLLVESHRMCLISWVMTCDSMSEILRAREAHWRLGAWNFYWGLIDHLNIVNQNNYS